MKLVFSLFLMLAVATASPAFATVSVSSPANGSTVPNNVRFAASANTDCSSGVAAMGVYVNGQLEAKQDGSSLNASVYLGGGTQTAYVQEWDYCGGATNTPVTVTVAGDSGRTPSNPGRAAATGGGTRLSNLQAVSNWNQWGQYPPKYDICNAPCPGIEWSMYQHYNANSLSGNATKFTIGGSTPYADVLWSNKLIGQGTTLNMPDNNRAIIPNIHHMTFDGDIYVENISVMQDLELDMNLFMDGVGMEFGTECNHLNGNVWDIWNNADAHWVHTSIPCNLNDQSWNHVSFTVQREANNDLTYQTITVNGQTFNIYQTVAPFHVPSSWYGMTVNYQMDGNHNQSTYSTVLDNLAVTYW